VAFLEKDRGTQHGFFYSIFAQDFPCDDRRQADSLADGLICHAIAGMNAIPPMLA
jgi:hypothetical protein